MYTHTHETDVSAHTHNDQKNCIDVTANMRLTHFIVYQLKGE